MSFVYDEDLPGGGQFYCPETGRHFSNDAALATHRKSKDFKRRARQLKEEQNTQATADAAVGRSKEVLPPAHPELAAARAAAKKEKEKAAGASSSSSSAGAGTMETG